MWWVTRLSLRVSCVNISHMAANISVDLTREFCNLTFYSKENEYEQKKLTSSIKIGISPTLLKLSASSFSNTHVTCVIKTKVIDRLSVNVSQSFVAEFWPFFCLGSGRTGKQ